MLLIQFQKKYDLRWQRISCFLRIVKANSSRQNQQTKRSIPKNACIRLHKTTTSTKSEPS